MSELTNNEKLLYESCLNDMNSCLLSQKEIYNNLFDCSEVEAFSDNLNTFSCFFDKLENFICTMKDLIEEHYKIKEKLQIIKNKKRHYKHESLSLAEEVNVQKIENEKIKNEFDILSNDYISILNNYQNLQNKSQELNIDNDEDYTNEKSNNFTKKGVIEMQNEINELNEKLNCITQEKEKLLSKLNSLQQNIKENYINKSIFQEEGVFYQNKIDELHKKLNHSMKVISELESKISNYKNSNEELTKQLEQYKTELSTMTNMNNYDTQETESIQSRPQLKSELNSIDLNNIQSHYFSLSNLDGSIYSEDDNTDTITCSNNIQITSPNMINSINKKKIQKSVHVISTSSFSVASSPKKRHIKVFDKIKLNDFNSLFVNVSIIHITYIVFNSKPNKRTKYYGIIGLIKYSFYVLYKSKN